MSASLAASNELCQEDCIHPAGVARARSLLQESAVCSSRSPFPSGVLISSTSSASNPSS